MPRLLPFALPPFNLFRSLAVSTIPALDAPVLIRPYAHDYLRKRLHLIHLKPDDIGKDVYRNDGPYYTTPINAELRFTRFSESLLCNLPVPVVTLRNE